MALVGEDEKSVNVIEIGFKALAICCLTTAGWEVTHWQLTDGLGCFKSAAPEKTELWFGEKREMALLKHPLACFWHFLSVFI